MLSLRHVAVRQARHCVGSQGVLTHFNRFNAAVVIPSKSRLTHDFQTKRKAESFLSTDKNLNALFIELKTIAGLRRDHIQAGGRSLIHLIHLIQHIRAWPALRFGLSWPDARKSADETTSYLKLRKEYTSRLVQLLWCDWSTKKMILQPLDEKGEVNNRLRKWRRLLEEDSQNPRPLLKLHEREEILETLEDFRRRFNRACLIYLLIWGAIIAAMVKVYRWKRGPKSELSL